VSISYVGEQQVAAEPILDDQRRHQPAWMASSSVTSHTVRAMEPGVAFTKLEPGGEDRFQRLRQELGITSFGLNLLRFRPGQGSRIHRHLHQEEAYLVLEGTLTLVIEGESRELTRGDLARVAPDVRRQLLNRHRERLLLVAVGGAQEHEGRDGRAYHSWEETGEGHAPADVPLAADVPLVD
jgi:mannose-6-phosphate isomerase-like protein (cupin superfamily)